MQDNYSTLIIPDLIITYYKYLLLEWRHFFPSPSMNIAVMELLILSYACKTSSAARIVAVMPYLPYSRQSRMRKRGSIACKLVAQMMKRSGKKRKYN